MSKFRDTLIKAAEKANQEGTLEDGELFRLRVATAFRPFAVARMEREMAAQGMSKGIIVQADGNVGAIDWANFFNFIKEMLPFIMQLIALF